MIIYLNEPVVKNYLYGSTVEEIMANWLDQDVTFTLCSMKRENQKEIIQSMIDNAPQHHLLSSPSSLSSNKSTAKKKKKRIDNGPVVDTIVHDKR